MSANVWEKANLIDKADVNRGGSPRPIEAFITEKIDGINWIKIGDVEKGAKYIEKTKERIIPEGICHSRKVEKGDFLLSNSMSFGRPYILHVEGCIHDGWLAIQNYNETFDTEFLYYLLSSEDIQRQYKSLAAGSTVLNLNKDIVAKATVIFPKDIEKQKHIADILSTCDIVIQNTQKTIDKYRAIKQGMMQDLFTRGLTKDGKLRLSYKEAPELYKESELGMIPKEWEIKALNEIYSKVTNAFVGTATPYYVESGHFYLESNNVKNGFINFNNKIFINDYFYEKQKNNLLHTGDLVMVQSGHVGHTAVIPEELNNTAAHAVIIIANPKIDASPYFYNYYFFSENAINMISKVTKGNTIKHILSSEMKNFKVCYPKMEEQLAIAKRLSSIDSTILKEEAVLEKYKNIKTGLMARLLTPPEDAEIIDETGE